MQALGVLFDSIKEFFRDPVGESYALRYKRLEINEVYRKFRSCRFNEDTRGMGEARLLHAKLCEEWEIMAHRYERRFLKGNKNA